MAILLAVAELIGKRKRDFTKLGLFDGLLVGIAQAFALVPGASRSGSTLTAGLFIGLKRETAARFLLSTRNACNLTLWLGLDHRRRRRR